MDILNFKYKKIKNFFSLEELDILKNYCKLKHMDNQTNFDHLQNNNHDTFFYKDPLMQVFLDKKRYLVEQNLGIKLFSSYSFWRCYTWGAVLEKHKDRPSCEFSVSALIDSDNKNWPLYMDNEPIDLDFGEAIIYKGTDVWHERKEFIGDYHMQTFLHYVNQNGPYKDYKGDEKKGTNK